MMRLLPLFVLLLVALPSHGEEARYSIPLGNSPSLGPESAPVTIIEFMDYQ